MNQTLFKLRRFKNQVLDLSLKKVKEEGLDKKGRVVTEGDIFYGKLADFALYQCIFSVCSECNKLEFNGM